jgi:hypothetical protein
MKVTPSLVTPWEVQRLTGPVKEAALLALTWMEHKRSAESHSPRTLARAAGRRKISLLIKVK